MKLEAEIKQNHFTDNYEKAIINILYTANWLRDIQNSSFKEHDLLIQHYNALRIINGRHPNPISPGEIKEVMLDKSNDLTRLLDKLVDKELIKRDLCENNRRKMDIVITAKGRKLIQKLEKPLNDIKAEIADRMTGKEAAQLNLLLDKLREQDLH